MSAFVVVLLTICLLGVIFFYDCQGWTCLAFNYFQEKHKSMKQQLTEALFEQQHLEF